MPTTKIVDRKRLDENIKRVREMLDHHGQFISKEAFRLLKYQFENADMIIITPIGNSIFLHSMCDQWARRKCNAVPATKLENEVAVASFQVFHDAFNIKCTMPEPLFTAIYK